MSTRIERIFLSAQWLPSEEVDRRSDYTDVIIRFEDGAIYAAAFFHYDLIEVLRERHAASGDFLGGKYFWAEGMVLTDSCTLESVREVVRHLLEEGDFYRVFRAF